MDFEFSAEEESYRREVRSWLAEHVPDWARGGSPLVAVVELPIPVIDLRAGDAPSDVVIAGHATEGTRT